jgi:hypothetical protein
MVEAADAKPGAEPKYADVLDDPAWINGVSELAWTKSPYGGFVLRGTCPVCEHDVGINVFVPTIWTSLVGATPTRVGGTRTKSVGIESVPDDVLEEETPATKDSELSAWSEVVRCSCHEAHIDTPSGKSGCGRWGFIPVPKVSPNHV